MLKSIKNCFALPLSMMLLILQGCDAPRLNPFDPGAENYQNRSTSKIFVRRLPFPNLPIHNARVEAVNLGQFGLTNQNGSVEFSHQPVDSLNLLVSADGFFEDTLSLPTNQFNEYQVLLNAEPVLSDIRFFSVFENWNNDRTRLEFNAQLTDIDGQSDIIDVNIFAPHFSFMHDLVLVGNELSINPQPQMNFFYIEEIDQNMTTDDLDDLEFYIKIVNFNGDSLRSGPLRIIRTIEKNLVPIRPEPQTTEVDSIVFQWEHSDLFYDFNYRVILQNGSNNLFWIYSDIPAGQNRFILLNPPNGLQEGVNFWFFQVYDRYGNACESNIIPFSYTR